MQVDVGIVGAGLSGLACARECARLGLSYAVFERAERVGGRVVSDVKDGFVLDRGFQVLLSSYPEVQAQIDLEALEPGRFAPGGLVRRGGDFWRVVDPWRSPMQGILTLRAPFVTLGDGVRMAQLRDEAIAGRYEGDARTTEAFLRDFGFTEGLIEAFLRPFFGGVTLDRGLGAPAWYFTRLFGWFARGDATLPARGMQALPEALAAPLDSSALHLGEAVEAVSAGALTLASGARVDCGQVVVATEADAAAALLGREGTRDWNGTTTLYYAADESPVGEPTLVVNGEGPGDGPVNHLCVLSDAQPSYAPEGRSLVSVSVLGVPEAPDPELNEDVRHQLEGWYGSAVSGWQLLRIDRLRHALPKLGADEPLTANEGGVLVCGDHLATPSIQGALESGRLAGAAAAKALGVAPV